MKPQDSGYIDVFIQYVRPTSFYRVFFDIIQGSSRHFLLFKEPEGPSQIPIICPLLSWLNPIHIFTSFAFFIEDAKQSRLSVCKSYADGKSP
jgi:hypothetical protein